jgi:hypothetical protein
MKIQAHVQKMRNYLTFCRQTVERESKSAVFRIGVAVVEVYPVVNCGTTQVMRKVAFGLFFFYVGFSFSYFSFAPLLSENHMFLLASCWKFETGLR